MLSKTNKGIVYHNAEMVNRNMPSNYREGELDFCRKEFSYQTKQIRKTNFKRCYLNFKGHLYDKNYVLINSSLIARELNTDSFFKYLKTIILGKKRTLTTGETYLFCFDQWSGNPYHWINDFLPRLCVLADELPNYTLLLADLPYVRNVGVQMLAYFDLKPGRVEWIQLNEVLKIPNLDFISHPVITGRTHDNLMQALRRRFALPSNTFPKKRRIYLSRSKATQRFVLNEEEVIALLQRHSFEIVYYEELSIHEQIRLTSEANLLVSIHGAGLANAIFMNPDSIVLEFRRDKMYLNQCFWHLSSALGLRYYYLFGQPDQDIAIEGGGCNLTIPIDQLQITIDRILHDLS